MREIKFRGKQRDTGEWSYGSLQCFKGLSIFDSIWKNFLPVDSKTVGQFTGMSDKDGRKIFEGDIIRFNGGYALGRWTGVVEYDDANACFVAKGERVKFSYNDPGTFKVCLSEIDKPTIEIIGNRWDDGWEDK